MRFEDLGLRPELLRAVVSSGYSDPTPIQEQTVRPILEGRDIMGGAQTGTGKTAAFALPILQRLADQGKGRGMPRALVLTPTRELAAQVAESFVTYGRYLPLYTTVVYGGVRLQPQIDRLERWVDVLVATPGRLLDLVWQEVCFLDDVSVLVLDEADRMLDMGFIPDIKKILKMLPPKRQNLLFSATCSTDILLLADGLLREPELIEVSRDGLAPETIEQVVYPVAQHRKRELLSHLIRRDNWKRALVFTRTKFGANRLASQLVRDGIRATAIHSNKTQAARSQALADFKRGAARVLVATDVAARGLDIEGMPNVVNYDLPQTPKDYVHRIGRTGRAGEKGKARSLVCAEERFLLSDIEKTLGFKLPVEEIEGFVPEPEMMHVRRPETARTASVPDRPFGRAPMKAGQRRRSGRR
jgi:ATP-dependent RNA helicase RhlE